MQQESFGRDGEKGRRQEGAVLPDADGAALLDDEEPPAAIAGVRECQGKDEAARAWQGLEVEPAVDILGRSVHHT